MSNITLAEWTKYRNALAKISQKAADELTNAVWGKNGYFEGAGLGNIPRNELINYIKSLTDVYSEASGALAAQMYDDISALEGAKVAAAEIAPAAEYSEVAKAVNGCLIQSPDGAKLGQVAGRLVKQRAADTTLQNAARDGAQFAWIPAGDTCAFCLTLASRGWQYQSKKTLRNGHAEHIHANCDCQYAIRHNPNTNVAGYDPQKYLKEYDSYSGKPKDKIRQMQNALDSENRDKINAQHREAYRLRKENEEDGNDM